MVESERRRYSAAELARDLTARDAAGRVRVEQQHDRRRSLSLSSLPFSSTQSSLSCLDERIHPSLVARPGRAVQGVAPGREVDGAEHGAGVGGALDDDEGAEARFSVFFVISRR